MRLRTMVALLGLAAAAILLGFWQSASELSGLAGNSRPSASLPATHMPPPPPPPPATTTSPASSVVDTPRGCPPHLTGAACDVPAFPTCAVQWGFNLSMAPCFKQAFPVSCECLAQCDAAGHGARKDCVTGAPILQLPQARAAVDLREAAAAPPWVGSPKALAREWPELVVRWDPALVAQLQADAAASRAASRCSGRGIWTAALAPARPAECVCLPGHTRRQNLLAGGEECVRVSAATACMRGCSGRGVCVGGTCVCAAGAAGIDCALDAALVGHAGRPVGPPRSAATAAANAATAASAAAPAASADASAASPRIFVYELPARFNTWLAVHPATAASSCGGASPCWWHGSHPMYSADVVLLRRLLGSRHRTLDPEAADYFYVPLLSSLGFVSHRFGIYMPSATAASFVDAVLTYLSRALPYWNRTSGADHLLPFTGDDGATWLRGRLPHLRHATLLTHWGYSCRDAGLRAGEGARRDACVTQQQGFRSHASAQDVVIPPLHSPHTLLPSSPWLRSASPFATAAALEPSRRFRYLLYFVGKVNRSSREGDIYSHGVRQRVFLHHADRTDFYLRNKPGARGAEEDAEALRASKFCLSPHGTGFGMRQYDAIALGCVPLIISVSRDDDRTHGGLIEQPLEEILPWRRFSLHLPRSAIPRLPELLQAISTQEHAAMRRAAACVWPRLFWIGSEAAAAPHAPADADAADAAASPDLARLFWQPSAAPSSKPSSSSSRSSKPSATASPPCGAACAAELEPLTRFDAFASLMWLLRLRLAARRAGEPPRAPEEYAAAAGNGSALAHPPLHAAEWRTPAASCAAALGMQATA